MTTGLHVVTLPFRPFLEWERNIWNGLSEGTLRQPSTTSSNHGIAPGTFASFRGARNSASTFLCVVCTPAHRVSKKQRVSKFNTKTNNLERFKNATDMLRRPRTQLVRIHSSRSSLQDFAGRQGLCATSLPGRVRCAGHHEVTCEFCCGSNQSIGKLPSSLIFYLIQSG